MKFITVFVCYTRDLVPTCSLETKSLSLSLSLSIIILTFLLYKISFHIQQCRCVVHSGCGPITASLHEGGGQITEIHRTDMWFLDLTSDPLTSTWAHWSGFQVTTKDIYINVIYPRPDVDSSHRGRHIISPCTLIPLRRHQKGNTHKWNIYNPYQKTDGKHAWPRHSRLCISLKY